MGARLVRRADPLQTIPIGHVVELRLGQKTQPFERRTQSHKYEHESYDRSFSLILMSGKTLDFVTASTLEFKLWVHSLIRLILSVQMEGPSFVYLFYASLSLCAIRLCLLFVFRCCCCSVIVWCDFLNSFALPCSARGAGPKRPRL